MPGHDHPIKPYNLLLEAEQLSAEYSKARAGNLGYPRKPTCTYDFRRNRCNPELTCAFVFLSVAERGETMPAFLPIILVASQVRLAADRMPEFHIDTICRAAAEAAVAPDRDAGACKRDELTAHDKLRDQWGQFTTSQKTRCVSLTRLDGNPSYVELLTCLELAKATKTLPPSDSMTGQGSSD
jgi:hypothetical protein